MAPSKPNILFVLADDMGVWALGCGGNTEIQTPNLDKLAERGTRLENFFCASPVCSPARASLLTGRIPSQHGVHDWVWLGNINKNELDEPHRSNPKLEGETFTVEYLANQPAYTEVLKKGGYTCALSGKWHLGKNRVPQKGFDRWFTLAKEVGSYKHPTLVEKGEIWESDEYLTDTITEKAITFLQEQSEEDMPFYLSVHYTAPHSPWERNDHMESFLSLYDDCPFEFTPDLPIHPNQNRITPSGVGERRKELLRGYYAAITAMDAGVGRILAKLDELGRREDTLVVFMSDNGMNLGHHGIWGKGNGTFPLNMYDTSVKIPAIFSHEGVIPQKKVLETLLSQYDFFPTLLEYAGLAAPDNSVTLPGISFASLLKDTGGFGRKDVVVHDEYGPVRMIRSHDWKYVHRYPFGRHELYNLKKDPNEDVNLVDDQSCSEIKESMQQRLGEWFAKYVVAQTDGASLPVVGFGQIGPVSFATREGKSFVPLPHDWDGKQRASPLSS